MGKFILTLGALLALLTAGGNEVQAKKGQVLPSSRPVARGFRISDNAPLSALSLELRQMHKLCDSLARSSRSSEAGKPHSTTKSAALAATTNLASLLMSDTFYSWVSDQWAGNVRTTYTYNSGRKLIDLLSQDCDPENGLWLNSVHETYEYDQSGRLTIKTVQVWIRDSGSWLNQTRRTYQYDVSGNPTTLLLQQWSVDHWENYVQLTTGYGANGKLTGELWQSWQGGVWVNTSRGTDTYDADGDLSIWLTEVVTDTGWEMQSRDVYSFDAGHRQTEDISQQWQANSWANVSRAECSYDPAGHLNLNLRSFWSGAVWSPANVDSLKYSGNLNTETIHFSYINLTSSRDNYSYDAGGNQVENLGTAWIGGKWLNSYRSVSVYQGFVCGDADGSGDVNVSDVVFLLGYIFGQGIPPNPLLAGDADCSGEVNVSDAVYLVQYIFGGGPKPCAGC